MTNGGTIPDRGLYGVFLAGEHGPGARVGELDEEMVFESRVGETFLLGASSWRIEQITHDRVLVSPAPGRAGQDAVLEGRHASGRPLELGRAVGELVRTLVAHAAGGGHRAPRPPPRSRRAGGREPPALSRRSDRGGRRRARRPHGAHRALPRRAGRLARLRALAVRQPHPRPLGHGRRRARPRGNRARRRDDVDRRRVRGAVPGDRRAAGSAADGARVRRSRGAGAATSSAERRCSRPSSARPRAARCSCPSAGPAAAARCGSCASARPTCSPSRRGSDPFRSSSRRIASACATSSTCRRSSKRSAGWSGARSGWRPWTRRWRRLSPRRCCLATSPTISTTATPRSPSGARRRCRSIRRSCASCSAMPSCATCSTRTRSPMSRPSCSSWQDDRRARTVDGVHDMLLRLGDLDVEEIDARAQIDGRRAADELTRARRAIAGHDRRPGAPHPRRVREPLPRRARRAAAAGAAGGASRAGATCRAGPRPPLRANACAVHDARSSPPGTGSDDRPPKRCCKELAARRAPARRRFPARRHGTRMVRPGRAADDPPPVARQAAASGRTGRTRRPRTAHHALAGRRPPAHRGWTRCSMRSRACRARRSSRRFSRPRSCRRASRAISRPISTR